MTLVPLRDLPITATIEFMGTEPTLHVTAPTRAFLDEGRSLEVTLASGTRLRHQRHYSWTEVCSQIYMDFDALLVMSGEYTGRVVYIEDAGTPRDRNAAGGFGPHLGPRPQLGFPASVVVDLSEMSVEERIDHETAPCGHSHPPAPDTIGVARWVAGTYRVVREADVTLLANDGRPDLRILLPPNTTIRVDAWIGHRSPMFNQEDTYRACVLDGRWEGRCVEIWDEGTPRSGESHGPVTLGLPPTFVRLPDMASDLRRARVRALRERRRA